MDSNPGHVWPVYSSIYHPSILHSLSPCISRNVMHARVKIAHSSDKCGYVIKKNENYWNKIFVKYDQHIHVVKPVTVSNRIKFNKSNLFIIFTAGI